MNTPIRARAKSWLINGALAIGGGVVALLVAELGLRAVGFSDPVLWTYDDITGSKLRPGATGWQRREGEAFITINSDGLRDREHSRAKPPNTIRVAILGASMAEALQVPIEKNFSSVLERELKSCRVFGDREVEVINFGVSGYGTAQELLTFRHRVAAYSPDVTILAFTPAHDVRNNSKELEPLKLSPFFSVQDGKLILDDSFLNNPDYVSFKSSFDARQILFNLRTFQLLRRLKFVLQQQKSDMGDAGRDTALDIGKDGSGFLPPTTRPWIDAWQITERLIATMRDEVVARGGRFLLFSIPVGVQVHPNPEVRNRLARELKVDDLWYPERRIREFADREKIDAVLVGEAFQGQAEKNQIYLHGFKNAQLGTGHLNETGHKMIGEALAKHLCAPR